MWLQAYLLALVVGLAAGAVGCRSATEPAPGRLEIVSRVEAMFPGQSESLLVAVDSVLAEPGTVQWSSADPTVLAVDSSGVANAIRPGTAAVVARTPASADTIGIQVIAPPSGRIAFVGVEQEPQPGDAFRLYEIQASGQGVRLLAPFFRDVGPPAFSPDGTMLALPFGSPPRILILSADAQRTLFDPTLTLPCGSSQPAWAPDGQAIAFSSCASGRFDVWVSSLDGSSRRQVTQFSQSFAPAMAFTPDGGALIVEAFVADSGATNPYAGQTELFNVSIETGVSRRLTATPESEMQPFVDTSGARLFFSREVLDAPASRPRAEAVAAFASDLEAGGAVMLTPLEVNAAGFALDARYPRTSPDGEWITFSAKVPRYPVPGMRLGDPMMQVAGQISVMRLQDRLRVRLTRFWSASQPSWTTP